MAEPAKKIQPPEVPPKPPIKRKRSPVNPDESKSDRFIRLGQKRVPRAIKAIAVCRNLASRSQYEYTAEQAKKIVDALTAEVSALRQAFEGRQDVLSMFKL